MSVNEEMVEARINEINDAIQVLGSLTGKGFGELTLYERLSMRYLIIQLVEAASSICICILLALFNEKAEGFPECFARLNIKKVIPEDLAYRLAAAARLRNLLVHRYWAIDDEKIYVSVKKGLEDFKAYVTHVREFLERRV